jgi:alkylhydroperoxidase family enzyme
MSDTDHPIRIPPLPRERWTDAAREVFAFWGEPSAWENGSKTNMQMVMANHPPLATAFNHFGKQILIDTTAPAWARELVTLRVAWLMKVDYEWHYHVGYALNLGMTLEQIAAIKEGGDAPAWSAIDAATLRMVDELRDTNTICDTTWATLSAHFSTEQLMDLIFALGQYVMLGWAIHSFGIQVESGVDRVGYDLKTASGQTPAAGLKPGENKDKAE